MEETGVSRSLAFAGDRIVTALGFGNIDSRRVRLAGIPFFPRVFQSNDVHPVH